MVAVVALEYLGLDLLALAAQGLTRAEAVQVQGLVAQMGLLGITRRVLVVTAGYMAAAAVVLVLTEGVPMVLVAAVLSVLSGALVVAIRQTPQTSN